MAGESKTRVIKKVMSEQDAARELSEYISEIAGIMQQMHGRECFNKIGDLVWLSKTGEKLQLRNMQAYHILAALRTLTTKEVANVVSGRYPNFSIKSMSIVALKLELARRYTEHLKAKKNGASSNAGSGYVNHWEIDQIKTAIKDIKILEDLQ
jgi:hypothetical protein